MLDYKRRCAERAMANPTLPTTTTGNKRVRIKLFELVDGHFDTLWRQNYTLLLCLDCTVSNPCQLLDTLIVVVVIVTIAVVLYSVVLCCNRLLDVHIYLCFCFTLVFLIKNKNKNKNCWIYALLMYRVALRTKLQLQCNAQKYTVMTLLAVFSSIFVTYSGSWSLQCVELHVLTGLTEDCQSTAVGSELAKGVSILVASSARKWRRLTAGEFLFLLCHFCTAGGTIIVSATTRCCYGVIHAPECVNYRR